ncbi:MULTISPECIES: head completion/stabilization protein [Pseudomonas]|uniref:Head completion/stabilization protein n=1 Tax=Pseudomonas wuhanensis TaxID=2954098 RepID=A0ABY9GX24_9PSED|nr:MULTISPECIES: head completion/stabilization protein [unclassified Pseudomonas]WLI14435.1 head completion/stabilization protein [Pseudomonas sp. FP603]WLI20351.1 head completion/stabilization protein [Pseudomonas sp. FP607]
MSGFVAGGTAPTGHINTDPFWPSIDLDDVRGTLRIDSSVTLIRLETATIAAAISVNRELAEWRRTKQTEGYTTLADVPAEQVKDVSQFVHLYQRAIYAATGAEICERYRSYDTTNSGNQNADELNPSIDELRRDQRWAVRDFLGLGRTTVELI